MTLDNRPQEIETFRARRLKTAKQKGREPRMQQMWTAAVEENKWHAVNAHARTIAMETASCAAASPDLSQHDYELKSSQLWR